jgi:hypothetical protein
MCLTLEIIVTIMLLIIVFEYEGGFQPAGSKASASKGGSSSGSGKKFLRG